MGKFLLLWVVILVIVVNSWGSLGCLEEERIALLHLKAHVMNNTYGNSLTSWIDDKRSDCCNWKRVTCSNITRRVIELHLYVVRDESAWNWYMNATVFLPFKQLNILDLSYNNLAGVVENGGFDKLSKLHNLNELDLSSNNLNRNILYSLSQISSLTHLYMDENPLDSPPNNPGRTSLSGLRNLEILRMSYTKMEDNNVLSALNLKDFISLKELYISDNKFKSFGPINGELKKLESLDLSNNRFNKNIFQWFKGLPSLKTLELRENDIHGRLRIQGFIFPNLPMWDLDCIPTINAASSNLEELYLSGNYIEGFETSASLSGIKIDFNSTNIFSSLKWFPSLKFLDLSGNDFHGPLHIQDINALSSLQDLDLSGSSFETSTSLSGVSSGIIKSNSNLKLLHLNNITCNNMTKLLQSLATLPSIKRLELMENNITSIEAIHALGNLSNTEELFLDYSYLHKDFLQSIGSMNSLKILSLNGDQLGGTLPNKGWCELRKLQELWLSENQLGGMLPPCLGNLTSLSSIALSKNKLIGNIGSSPLSTLMSLKYLSISNTSFEIPSSFQSFANHTKLRGIRADGNKVISETELQSLVPKFQLKFFSMSSCIGFLKLPTFLHYQHSLTVLEISGNNFEGEFPNWLLQNNTKLKYVVMNSNAFTGTLKLPSHLNPDLSVIDFSGNKLCGEFPNNLSSTFPNVEALNFSYNLFESQIPSSLGNLKELMFLDLSNNSFTGEIPKEMLIGCSSLSLLKLSNNKLEGEIVQEFGYLSSLGFLYIDGNSFTGTIPDSLSNTPFLILDISGNKFSGEIPRWIGHIKSLQQLSLSRNHLEGPIPTEFCNLESLSVLDLSENNLTGSVPPCLNPSSIKHVHLSKNRLGGQLTRAFFNSTALVIFDLSHNDFVGAIPEWIGNLSELSILLLNGNRFEGKIPFQVCQLLRLSVLDLSNNLLSGMIPHCLGKLSLEVTDEKSTAINLPLFFFGIGSITFLTNELENEYIIHFSTNDEPPKVEFRTKGNLYKYGGSVLKYMSGIDLSANRLIGEIPFELGNLTKVHALNLSHNNLNGTIPEAFSKLANIESLDLSHNMLSGKIPNTLLDLYPLEVFSVAYNNLSGAIPEPKAQFATFDERSYAGNPYLCGPQLQVSCSSLEPPSSPLPTDTNGESEESSDVDMEVLYVSFCVSYVIFFVGVVSVLYINPYWRNTLFHRIEVVVHKWFG